MARMPRPTTPARTTASALPAAASLVAITKAPATAAAMRIHLIARARGFVMETRPYAPTGAVAEDAEGRPRGPLRSTAVRADRRTGFRGLPPAGPGTWHTKSLSPS